MIPPLLRWFAVVLLLLLCLAVIPAAAAWSLPTDRSVVGVEWNASDPSPSLRWIDGDGNTLSPPDFNNHVVWGNVRKVLLTDASTNAPTGYFWTFRDGRTSIAQSPSHTYNEPGTYTVALTVTNAGGSDTETKNGYITVSAAPPTAPTEAANSPAFPYSQQRKETLSFLLMCWGALAFVGVFCVVIFLLMNGAQRGSGGI